MTHDEHKWTTDSGLPALVAINPNGYRCGYVDVSSLLLFSVLYDTTYFGSCSSITSPLDPLYEAFDDISVHGGITFNSNFDGLHLIGFDCAHWGDAPIPEYTKSDRVYLQGTVRSLDYCIDQCEFLAKQILAINSKFSYLLEDYPEEFI